MSVKGLSVLFGPKIVSCSQVETFGSTILMSSCALRDGCGKVNIEDNKHRC